MFTAEECSKCKPTSTCGFSCYFYWHSGRPTRRVEGPRTWLMKERRGRLSLENECPKQVETHSNRKRTREVINLCEEEEDINSNTTATNSPSNSTNSKPILDQNSAYEDEALPDQVQFICHRIQNQDEVRVVFDQIPKEYAMKEPICNQTLKKKSLSTLSSSENRPEILDSTSPAKPDSSLTKSTSSRFSCIERKRIIVFNRPKAVSQAMQTWYETTLSLFDPFRSNEDCWFHPSPLLPRSKRPTSESSILTNSSPSPRAKTTISKKFHWSDPSSRHSISLNFGIVSKLLTRTMTMRQKDGFITKGWHLSHLCGNWTCLNPNHATVEPGNVNLARNNCFSHRSGCTHRPPCMKERKVPLGLGLVAHAESSSGFDDGEFEDWQWHCFDNDDDLWDRAPEADDDGASIPYEPQNRESEDGVEDDIADLPDRLA